MIKPEETYIPIIERSYANNSSAYSFFASEASLEQIVSFLHWDADQPAFNIYLRQWLEKCPKEILPGLEEHIAEEEDQEHSRLFMDMFNVLKDKVQIESNVNNDITHKLNYTFSKECAQNESFDFFLGSFLATEYMSAKRCKQLFDGLLRLGVDRKELEYLEIHFTADADHYQEVINEMIIPCYNNNNANHDEILNGIHDRLNRSAEFLKWYEDNFIKATN
jgi:hypothetical protein